VRVRVRQRAEVSLERRPAYEHLELHTAQRVEVRSTVHRVASGLLRGDVARRSAQGERGGEGLGRQEPCDPHVYELHAAGR